MRRPSCLFALTLVLVACGSADSGSTDGSGGSSGGAGAGGSGASGAAAGKGGAAGKPSSGAGGTGAAGSGGAAAGSGGTSGTSGGSGGTSAGSGGTSGGSGGTSAGAGGTSAGAGGTSAGSGGMSAGAGGTSAGAGGATAGAGGTKSGGSGGAMAGAGGVSGSSGQGGSGGGSVSARRGLYLSLYTDHNGQIVFTGPLDPYKNIVGDGVKEQHVLDYIAAHGINAISLYDLGTIAETPGKSAALASFMGKARKAGVVSIEAVGAQSTSLWDLIANFHQTQAPFDGVVTEIEFWNGGVVGDATSALGYVQSFKLKRMDGTALSYGSYLGWVKDSDIAALVPYVDRLYLHAYVTDPALAYDYVSTRAQAVATANAQLGKDVEVVPIYSAEGVKWSAGAEHFMGDWLSTGSLDSAESTFRGAWMAKAPAKLRLGGFQYFEYFFLAQYVP